MHFMGGKVRQSKDIWRFVDRAFKTNKYSMYIEPFCGGLSSAVYMRQKLPHGTFMQLSDNDESLISMWRAALNGYKFPDGVTKEQYWEIRQKNDPCNPLTAFCKYGLSFSGKPWGSFCGTHSYEGGLTKNQYAIKGINKKISILRNNYCSISHGDYTNFICVKNCVVYLDPPYDTGKDKIHGKGFDHKAFWEYVREMSMDNYVLITEFNAPDDFISVHSWGNTLATNNLANTTKKVVSEQIFVYKYGQAARTLGV